MGYKSPRIYTIVLATAYVDYVDSTTYYYGQPFSQAQATTTATTKAFIPKKGIIRVCSICVYHATLCSNESLAYSIRLNDTTDYAIETKALTLADGSSTLFSNSNLNIAVNAGDFIQIKLVTPAWATNPTAVRETATVLIECE